MRKAIKYQNTLWNRCELGYLEVVYIITNELHILNGVTLKIDDKTKVLLCNSYGDSGYEKYGQVVFDTGSKLKAEKIISYGIDDFTNIDISEDSDNGGWYFYGNNCRSEVPADYSIFAIKGFEGSSLGSVFMAAISFDEMTPDNLKRCDEVELTNCGYYNFRLCNSCINIKKLKVEVKNEDSYESCFIIDKNSNLAIIKELIVDIYALFTKLVGNLTISKGALIDIKAKEVGINMYLRSNDKKIKNIFYDLYSPISISTDKNNSTGIVNFYNTTDYNDNDPEKIIADGE